MVTTPKISFSDEKKTGSFKYESGEYVITGNAAANLADGSFLNASGSIRKADEEPGNMPIDRASFNAHKVGDEVKVNISGVASTELLTITPIVTACIAKVSERYK